MKKSLLIAAGIAAVSVVASCGSTDTSSAPTPSPQSLAESSTTTSALPSSAPSSTPVVTTTVRPAAATTTTSIPVGGSPSEHYTGGTTPEAPGTACGAATGTRVITIVKGSISCREARLTVEQYLALPADGNYGNANIREFGDGWSCSTPTAGAQAGNGWRYNCTNDARGIQLHSY